MLIPGFSELAVALTLTSVQAPVPYHNPRYGFALSAPRGHTLCVDGPPAPDRCAFLLLSAPCACPAVVPFDALYISVSASYNPLEDKTLKETARKRSPRNAARAAAPRALHFA